MKITVNHICKALEELAPLALQESYDNSGLLLGNRNTELSGVLICIDVTEEVLHEAITANCNMIVSHHPLVFTSLKSITESNMVERCIVLAIKHNLAIYACHTNLDSVSGGVSFRMAQKIGLTQTRVLQAKKDSLLKLVTFVPLKHLNNVQTAIFEAGGGQIGKYDCCSFTSTGKGSFRASEGCHPFVGKIGKIHTEDETRLEIIIPAYLKTIITKILLQTHPYEEPAFDFIPIRNDWSQAGYGIIGNLEKPTSEKDFLFQLKKVFKASCIKHTSFTNKKIQKVAMCGGSGATLINLAIASGADVYVSADFKYHDYFLAESKLLIADIGHFESEQFTKEIIFEHLTKKLSKFAIRFSEINTNPINYI